VNALQGWVSIHRKIMNNPVWQDPKLLKLWMLCLLEASHKDHEQLVGKQIVKLQPGQFVTGRFSLASVYNEGAKKNNYVPEITLWRWLKMLETYDFLNIKTTTKYSIVTIKNWLNYQPNEQQMNNKRTTNEQQLITNNNGNKGKNENNDNKKPLRLNYENCDMEMAELLFEKMLENNQGVKKPNLEIWANEVRLMRENDNRSIEQISFLINWTQSDYFWKSNILSISKLRKKWDQLVLKCKEDRKKSRTGKAPIRQEKLPDNFDKPYVPNPVDEAEFEEKKRVIEEKLKQFRK
jgi:hypothetical protein